MSFQDKLQEVLAHAGEDILIYDVQEAEHYKDAYTYIEEYANHRELLCTAAALPIVRGIMSQAASQKGKQSDRARYRAYFEHCLAVGIMLIDLHIPLKQQEEDYMLAAAICHVLPETPTAVTFENLTQKLSQKYHLAKEVADIVSLITREDGMSAEKQRAFYERIQENKLATLIRLADRGNLVQQLYGIATWSAKEYIYETREYFFPLCIYAKEHYPELMGPISVLMEKMRCHIEISEIMLSKYEAREQELMKDILAMKEENSRIRFLLQKMKKSDTENK